MSKTQKNRIISNVDIIVKGAVQELITKGGSFEQVFREVVSEAKVHFPQLKDEVAVRGFMYHYQKSFGAHVQVHA